MKNNKEDKEKLKKLKKLLEELYEYHEGSDLPISERRVKEEYFKK